MEASAGSGLRASEGHVVSLPCFVLVFVHASTCSAQAPTNAASECKEASIGHYRGGCDVDCCLVSAEHDGNAGGHCSYAEPRGREREERSARERARSQMKFADEL